MCYLGAVNAVSGAQNVPPGLLKVSGKIGPQVSLNRINKGVGPRLPRESEWPSYQPSRSGVQKSPDRTICRPVHIPGNTKYGFLSGGDLPGPAGERPRAFEPPH